jgi:hypothetical protein
MGLYTCLVCGGQFMGGTRVCSPRCLGEARRELRLAMSRCRDLDDLPDAWAERYTIASRVGQLSAAVLSWGAPPEPSPQPG